MKWWGATLNYIRIKDIVPDQWTEFKPCITAEIWPINNLSNECHSKGYEFLSAVDEYGNDSFDSSKECGNCGTSKHLKRCRRCKHVWFCSTECQKTSWIMHKSDCKKAKVPKFDDIKPDDLTRINLRH